MFSAQWSVLKTTDFYSVNLHKKVSLKIFKNYKPRFSAIQTHEMILMDLETV